MTAVQRGFVTIGAGQILYRRAGLGPPALLIPPGLASGKSMVTLMKQLAAHRTVFAIDLPGFGESDSLPVPEPTVGDYATACVEAIDGLGIERIDLYGKENGARVALAIAMQAPQRVRSLFLDDLSFHDSAETADLVQNYAPSLDPQWDGSHLLRAWSICRDGHLFSPWYAKNAAHRVVKDMPAPDTLHDEVVDVLRAGQGYGKAALAGFRFDPLPALLALRIPTTLALSEQESARIDWLWLQALPAALTLQAPSPNPVPLATAIASLWNTQSAGRLEASPGNIPFRPVEQGLSRDFISTPHGQVHVRRGGKAGTPLLLFHSSPGSGLSLLPLAEGLSATRPVVVVDTLGYGDSDKPTWHNPELAAFAQVMLEMMDNQGWFKVDAFGSHTGAAIALELAAIAPTRVRSLILHDLGMFNHEEQLDFLAHHIPPFPPQWDGSHLIQMWNYARNRTLFFPWHKQDAAHTLKRDIAVADIQTFFVDLLKAGNCYSVAYRAAFEYPGRERLGAVQARTLLTTRLGGPMKGNLERASAIRPDIRTETVHGFAAGDALRDSVSRFDSFLSQSSRVP